MRLRLAILIAIVASLSGCQAAAFAAVNIGLSIVVHATELDNAIGESIRQQTGLCVSVTFQQKPCPPSPPSPP